VLVEAGMAPSRSEALRLIKQGGVSVDGVKLADGTFELKDGNVIKVGKRRFARVFSAGA